MSGDYTRFTFKPAKDYSGVLKQQGRVDLDADWNELIEIVDRRWRSETIDIVGHCMVPRVPAGTPLALDPFLVIPTAIGPAGDFDIGIGRMYVDGIQVENHGLPPPSYQADLGELRGTLPVPYANQPYLPAPLPPPLAAAPGTTDLVYVDVWQREVTVLEDPSIREIALGGPDTATRVQAVWQVRVLEDVGEHGCGDGIERWNDTVAPSAGRLTTSTVPPPASDDPCIISPTGGYRGLENRLYRVEIHSVGPIGGGAPAKFKWSRNNATIASSVTDIPSSTQVTVQQVGRDQVLRFEIGNWVEITDDFRELQGLAGHIAQVTAIDVANRVLTFGPAIPGSISFDPTNASRHTRVRRWDQTQNVDANGLLDVTAGPLAIEDGIQVTFTLDPAGGNFKVDDYWVFAARTADGSVEALQQAPPRGILHHFCRLGFIHWANTLDETTFTDCRERWPPLCCEGGCTVTVGDGVDSHGQFTDIQQAINALGNRGGVVCIARGFYVVRESIVLDSTKRKVIIRGMGPATRIVFAPRERPGALFEIRGTEHVRLEHVFALGVNAAALVRISGSSFCRIQDCILVNLPTAEQRAEAARAIDLDKDCSHCEIVHNALVGDKAIAGTTGRVSRLVVRENQALSRQAAVVLREAEGVEILHNQFRGIPQRAFPSVPEISRQGIDDFQLQVSGAFREPASFTSFQAAGVVIYTGTNVVISRNLITAHIAFFGFLSLNTRIEQNDLLALVGVVIIFGLVIKVEDNFVLALFAGFMHAGLLFDLDCTSNEWLGRFGILWMTLAQMLGAFGPLFASALGFVGFAGAGDAAVSHGLATGTNLAGDAQGFGMVVIAKVHRNVFFTFLRGIYKTDAVVSADVSIVDNTFSLCSQAAIELGGGGHRSELLLGLLAPFLNLRHLVQSNALAVRGRGIVSGALLTCVEQNSVQCPSIAIELDAPFCTARGNFILGLEREPALDTGLIILHGRADNASLSGNRLVLSPGHGILIQQDVSDLAIDDNVVQGTRGSAIAARHEGVRLRRARIARNDVQNCRGDAPAGLLFGGVIVVGDGEGLRLIDNTVANNSPTSGSAPWFAVYLGDVDGVEISGNTVTDNASAGRRVGFVGIIVLAGATGAIRIQGNIVRDNGGIALLTFGAGEQVQRMLVQDNHFVGPPEELLLAWLFRARSLLFEDNHCLGGPGGFVAIFVDGAGAANVSGNSFENFGPAGMFVSGTDLVVNANYVRSPGDFGLNGLWVSGGSRAIVTSNLTSALHAFAPTLVLANNLP